MSLSMRRRGESMATLTLTPRKRWGFTGVPRS